MKSRQTTTLAEQFERPAHDIESLLLGADLVSSALDVSEVAEVNLDELHIGGGVDLWPYE
jgi:hypothetical protein